jgi:hypothetical protein
MPNKTHGYLYCRTVTKRGRTYLEYWFKWEDWIGGKRFKSYSCYVPARCVSVVESLSDSAGLIAVLKYLKVPRSKFPIKLL